MPYAATNEYCVLIDCVPELFGVACMFTVFGGLGFSRLLHMTDDLALVVLVHWLVTFLNTPRPPRGQTPSKA